ncbi:MAG: tRNA lysidine(34) synthetase TilS [Pseudomonadota bacterium]
MEFRPDFDALIERFSPNSDAPIAIAVSGGSDSVALLSLASDWSKRSKRSLLVLTVDHGLRPEAADEAEWVAKLARSLGHPHRTLLWKTPRVSQNAARRARYELLAQAAEASGATILLTGHTFEDVVETALLRRRRGVRTAAIVGPHLASPLPSWPLGRGVSLVRPLINSNRRALQSSLADRHQDWVEDPSNQNRQFERVRIRTFLQRHPRLAELATKHVRGTQLTAASDRVQLAEALKRIRVDASGLIDTDDVALTPSLLQILARCASGTATNPRYGAVTKLLAEVNSCGERRTLNGAWFQKRTQGMMIGRDPGQGLERVGAIHDGRYVQDPSGHFPKAEDLPFLMRATAPSGSYWREIVSERLAHIIQCYQTPLLNPVQR